MEKAFFAASVGFLGDAWDSLAVAPFLLSRPFCPKDSKDGRDRPAVPLALDLLRATAPAPLWLLVLVPPPAPKTSDAVQGPPPLVVGDALYGAPMMAFSGGVARCFFLLGPVVGSVEREEEALLVSSTDG